MKKLLLGLLITILCYLPMTYAGPGDAMNYSDSYTADQLVRTGACNLYGIWIITDGTNAVTVEVYDNTSATGSTVIPATIVLGTATNTAKPISFFPPRAYTLGHHSNIFSLCTSVCFFNVQFSTSYHFLKLCQ